MTDCTCLPDSSPCDGEVGSSARPTCWACAERILNNPDAYCINDPEVNA